MFRSLAFIALLAFCLPAAAQSLSPADIQHYKLAFRAIDKGDATSALTHAGRAEDRGLMKAVQLYVMSLPDNPYNFAAMAGFIEKNRDWPNLRALAAQMEKRLPDSMSPVQIVNWFNAHPPISLPAFHRYIEALQAQGNTEHAAQLVRQRWIDGDFQPSEQTAFLSRFESLLRGADHAKRLDRLLEDGDRGAARRVLAYVAPGTRTVAAARLALIDNDGSAPALLRDLSPEQRADPGLMLTELRAARQKDRDAEAVQILDRQPQDLPRPESWWTERHIMARRMIERRDYAAAYRLAASHGLEEGQTFSQAEFLAGWLALRFLQKPDIAAQHFARLYESSNFPISKSRGAYWLGRTCEDLQDAVKAKGWYQAAAQYPLTFYGQLAYAKINPGAPLKLPAADGVSREDRGEFAENELIRTARQLRQIGETRRMAQFLNAAVERFDSREDFVLFAALALKLKRPDFAIKAAKRAGQKGIALGITGYPMPQMALPDEPEPALVLSLMRQESMFDPMAISPAGARGLMQLMPGTGRELARKLGLPFREAQLCEPRLNTKLGCRFLADRLAQFDGSAIMAVAAYNAGPGRVRTWENMFGNPQAGIDPIDWIESIPIYETRNYVQRVIEGMQIYRARLQGPHTPLRILQDLGIRRQITDVR